MFFTFSLLVSIMFCLELEENYEAMFQYHFCSRCCWSIYCIHGELYRLVCCLSLVHDYCRWAATQISIAKFAI